jgi:hypothetical protein
MTVIWVELLPLALAVSAAFMVLAVAPADVALPIDARADDDRIAAPRQ